MPIVDRYRSENLSAIRKAMATPGQSMDALATPTAKGGLWTVPLFEAHPNLVDEFDRGFIARLVLLKIDLSNFSASTSPFAPDKIRAVLSPFYEQVVNSVYSSGGLVEKFIGDAVVAIFGHPFRAESGGERGTDASDLIAALGVARRCIAWANQTNGESMPAKAALTMGEVFVGWAGTPLYSDLTIIGQPVTELFRLESVAPKQGVILPKRLYSSEVQSAYNAEIIAAENLGAVERPYWHHLPGERPIELPGIDPTEVIKINYVT